MKTFRFVLMSDTLRKKNVHYFVHIARLNNEQIHMLSEISTLWVGIC